MDLSESFLQHFEPLSDPRIQNHNFRHQFEDILTITLLGCICGADTWIEICEFAQAKHKWLSGFLALPNGIPSHDTFGRVFSRIDTAEFSQCFMKWTQTVSEKIRASSEQKPAIAIDGKTLRRAHNRKRGCDPLHLVSAWCSQQNLLLGQVRTQDKSNEIEAIPRLLDMLDIKGSIVTIDAMGCQKSVAKKITEKHADFILSLKDNQPNLAKGIAAVFKQGEAIQFKKMLNSRRLEKVHDHGRVETRRYTLVSCKDSLLFELSWPGLKSIGMLEVTRTVNHEVTRSVRYFLTSLSFEFMNDFMYAVRNHWNIEINLHWSLDVSFREDENRTRQGDAAENLAIIRRIALNLLKHETTNKRGIAAKRKRAGWDNDYLFRVLTATNYT